MSKKLSGNKVSRRNFVKYFSSALISSKIFLSSLQAQAQQSSKITVEMIEAAEKIAGLSFTPEERSIIVELLNSKTGLPKNFVKNRDTALDVFLQPAVLFKAALPGSKVDIVKKPSQYSVLEVKRPDNIESASFYSVMQLARLIETRQVTSNELTRLYLWRLKKYNPILRFAINLTEKLALKQAKKADQEIAAGKYKGPLHGIPWGIKDVFSVKDYPTTWGASSLKHQIFEDNATVVSKLEEAGAVLVAKLSTGAYAYTDVWFGGQTKNPWDIRRGSEGSSSGPASATSAGCVGFSIGTETQGSIIVPSAICGVTGLRPTFGRVSRYGSMPVNWTIDKVGPICRSVEDCAVVLDAIQGPDDKDNTVEDVPFNWNSNLDISQLKVAYVRTEFEYKSEFDIGMSGGVRIKHELSVNNKNVLKIIKPLVKELKPIEIDISTENIDFIYNVEFAAATDQLLLDQQPELLENNVWANFIKTHRFVPAVEYIKANRIRTQIMREVNELFEKYDVIIEVIRPRHNLFNLTGHPALVVPNGFVQGLPSGVVFTGKLFGEAELLGLGKAYQDATDHHLKHPPLRFAN